jgi:dimethylamine monooxygenase subunit A
MIKYFPFAPQFNLKMGTMPMKAEDTVVEIDAHYLNELALKRSLLQEDHTYYFAALDESAAAQWEVVEKVIDDIVKHDSDHFSVVKNGLHWHFTNKRLNESFSFTFGDDSTLSLAPLDWIGRQVQEDLIILNQKGEVIAGQLCFPSGWAMEEKIGKQFMEVHAPLPAVTNPMIETANKFIAHLPVNKSFARNNWGFRYGDQLDLSSKYSATYREKLETDAPFFSNEEVAEKIFLRVEHQTLTRLANSEHVLFTIHTYHHSVKEVVADPVRTQTLLSYLQGAPAELIEYKVMTPIYPQLVNYLNGAVSAHSAPTCV